MPFNIDTGFRDFDTLTTNTCNIFQECKKNEHSKDSFGGFFDTKPLGN